MKRSEVKDCYKWNLDSVMRAEEWEKAFASLSENKNALSKYVGKLKDKDALLACLKEESDLSLRIENLYVYAKMKQDENTAIASSQSMVGRANNLAAEISASASFISPEIIASYTEEELVALSREKAFEDYSYVADKPLSEREFEGHGP